ncbi:membrane protein insertion efficiency factor YidD [Lentisphaera araneosa]|uniref:membrane protein insertion efficiency factor YidD n=1 Tax=Lentisphaera araneosa TaxID=256847 RepID=UPI001EE66367|nr:membrane protein insertion efficiency factor YidD [Lentisphaera araneosa]
MIIVWLYQKCLSPLFPPVCRFHPNCSNYSRQALSTHGFLRGFYLTIKRIFKCHPFYKGSNYDPVPDKKVTKREK